MKINTKLLSVCAALLLAGAQIVGADGDGEMVQRLDGEMRIVEGHIPVPKSNGDGDYEIVDATNLNIETENGAKLKLDSEIIGPVAMMPPYQQFVDENPASDGTNKEGAAHIKTVIELPVLPTQVNVKEVKKELPAVVAEDEPSGCCGCFSGLLELLRRKR